MGKKGKGNIQEPKNENKNNRNLASPSPLILKAGRYNPYPYGASSSPHPPTARLIRSLTSANQDDRFMGLDTSALAQIISYLGSGISYIQL